MLVIRGAIVQWLHTGHPPATVLRGAEAAAAERSGRGCPARAGTVTGRAKRAAVLADVFDSYILLSSDSLIPLYSLLFTL